MDNNQLLYALIFSKDRACQIDSLLRSMRDHIQGEIHSYVLYRATAAALDTGYEIVKNRGILPNITWVSQTDFKADVIAILESIPAQAPILLLVDDDVFFRGCNPVEYTQVFAGKHLFIDLCFFIESDLNRNVPFIRTEPYYEWKWFYWIKGKRPRMYPFSLDGHIYRTGLLRALVSEIDFKAPNSLESALHACKRRRSVRSRNRAIAPALPVLFNNPLNSVQSEGETAHQNLSVDDFNTRYCNGMEIDNEALYALAPTEAHFPAQVFLRKR